MQAAAAFSREFSGAGLILVCLGEFGESFVGFFGMSFLLA